MNILLRQQPSIVLISWPNTWLQGIPSDSSQSRYRWISEQKGRIEKIRNHRRNMHDSSAATLCVFPWLEPRDLFSMRPTFSTTFSIQQPFQPGDCYLFTRSRDYRLLCVFTSASPSFSPNVYVFHFLSSVVFPSSALVSVLSPAIECFRATLVAPRLLVVVARSRLPCVSMPQLKKGQSFKMS